MSVEVTEIDQETMTVIEIENTTEKDTPGAVEVQVLADHQKM
jgi:hypothetical protein